MKAHPVEVGAGWEMVRGEAFSWLLQQPDESADALIADPPYSSGGFTRGDRMGDPSEKYSKGGACPSFSGDNRDQRGYLRWCSLWLTESFRVLREGAPICIWTDWRQLPVTTDALQIGGFVWRGVAVWSKKEASRPQRGRFRADAEFIVWGSKGPMPARAGVGVLPGSWTCAPVHHSKRLHIAEKPLPVMESIVQIAPPGGLVLDIFAGAASTGAACLRQGRRFIGVERTPIYFDRAVARLRATEKARPTFIPSASQPALFGVSP